MSVLTLVHNALIFICIGAFAGITAGALGICGGLVVVPGLLFIFQSHFFIPPSASMHVAAGTSLAIMVLTSLSSIRAHLKRGHQFSPVFQKLWPGLLLGTMFGVLVSQKISTYWLKLVFGIFLLVVAIKMYMDLHVKHASQFPSKWMNGLVNFIIGVQSGLFGIGGGILTIPYLTYCGLDPRKTAAISNLCTLLVALVGSVMSIITGFSFMRDIIPISAELGCWGYIPCI